jgi:PTS system nitrogen regulatory IIA component
MKEMELKIKDVAQLVSVSEKTIYRWIIENKIPAYRVNHQYRFNRDEINNWLLANKLGNRKEIPENPPASSSLSISELFAVGGIYYKIEGNTVEEAIKNSIDVLTLPAYIRKEKLFEAVLEREQLMSTAIGKGIAIPHPREPMIASPKEQSISLCFLDSKIDYNSLDAERVSILFFILSSNPKNHLELLYKIIFLCHQKEFIALLQKQALRNEIYQYVKEQEKEWALTGTGERIPQDNL